MGELFPDGSRSREAFARMKIKLRYTVIFSVLGTLFPTLLVIPLENIVIFAKRTESDNEIYSRCGREIRGAFARYF